jgi:endo-1,4-beta-xylanase
LPTTLRDSGRLVGVALAAARLADPVYAETAGEQFNQLTPENEMKWETIEPVQGQFDFGPADTLVEFAQSHGMQVRGHTLVWHSQLPAWVNTLTGDDLRAAMTNHIQTVVGHFRDRYPGVVTAWDVVNEAMNPMNVPPGAGAMGAGGAPAAVPTNYRDSVFYRELGEDFIPEAFRLAHDADPDALLYYNDFGAEGSMGAKSTAVYTLVTGMLDAGVPIHGVGFQMHTSSDDRGPGFVDFQNNVARYAALGLQIDVTEMDISLCALGDNTFSREAQRFRYNHLASACAQSPQCRSVSVWGLGDANSWLNDTGCGANAGNLPAPLLFDDAYARKPAWWGFYDGLTGCTY